MRIDQLPVASSATNLNTLPLNIDGVTEQISVGNLSNAIRDDVYGAPLTASTSSAMTDQTRVYVYTGTTSGNYTNGHWYYYNGSAWTDGGVYNSSAVTTDTTLTLSGVPADAKATGNRLVTVMNIRGSIAANTNIDTNTLYRQPGMYSVANSAASTITGWPSTLAANGRGGVLEVINALSYPTISSGGVVQVVTAFMSSAIHRMFRLYIGSAWQPWTNLATDADVANAISTALGDYVTDTDLASELSGYFGMRQTLEANASADTIFQPGTYYITNTTSSTITGWPFAPRGGLLITVNAIAYPFTSTGGVVQMAICYRTNGDTVAAYRQYIGGAWQTWQTLATENNAAPVDNRSFNIFRKFVTIGDSMSRGQVYANPDTHSGVRRDTHLAWGNRIATELGTEWIDQGAGGMSTRAYINGFTESNDGVTRSIDDTLDGTKDAPAYVIGLGLNDDVSGTALGSLSDFTPGTVPSTKPSLSATFYAAYGYIINRILDHYSDKVYIYLLTIPYYPTQTDATNLAKNTAIRAIAEAFHTAKYHVYCADMAQRYANWYRPNGKLYGCWVADHLTGLGYSVSADLTLRMLNETIQTYAGEYYDADFIASNMT